MVSSETKKILLRIGTFIMAARNTIIFFVGITALIFAFFGLYFAVHYFLREELKCSPGSHVALKTIALK